MSGEGAERIWRQMLWFRHGCPQSALYGDDGEMQCAACLLDFKRSSAEEIQERFRAIGTARLAAAVAPAEPTPTTAVLSGLAPRDPPSDEDPHMSAWGGAPAIEDGARIVLEPDPRDERIRQLERLGRAIIDANAHEDGRAELEALTQLRVALGPEVR